MLPRPSGEGVQQSSAGNEIEDFKKIMPPKIDAFTNMRRSKSPPIEKKDNDMHESGKDAKDKETFGLDEISLRAEMRVSAPS